MWNQTLVSLSVIGVARGGPRRKVRAWKLVERNGEKTEFSASLKEVALVGRRRQSGSGGADLPPWRGSIFQRALRFLPRAPNLQVTPGMEVDLSSLMCLL
jgi:hypothetical protein